MPALSGAHDICRNKNLAEIDPTELVDRDAVKNRCVLNKAGSRNTPVCPSVRVVIQKIIESCDPSAQQEEVLVPLLLLIMAVKD